MSKQAVDKAYEDGFWLDKRGVLQQERGEDREAEARVCAARVAGWLGSTLREFRRADYDESLVCAVEAGEDIGVNQLDVDAAFRDGFWIDVQGVLRQEQSARRCEYARANADKVIAWLKRTEAGDRAGYTESLVNAVEAGKRIGVCLRGKEVADFKEVAA